MPNRKLLELYRAGLDVYPPGMRGLAAAQAQRVKPVAAKKFLEWVKATHPRLYAAAEKKAGVTNGGGGLAAVETKTKDSGGALDRLLTTITSIAPQYLSYRAQQDVLDVQLDRMRQGLPPLSATQYAPGVQVSVDPSMYAPQFEALKPWLLYGGLALAGVFVVSQFSKRRR